MVKYICQDCPEPCEITVVYGTNLPICCPYRLTWKVVNWHEAAENLQDKPLPKLTAEVFDRPDCPEWAKYAAVDRDGMGRVFGVEPMAEEDGWYSFGIEKQAGGGRYDASDWQNSLIERHAVLPDWCKVGKWVYCDNNDFYAKIVEINDKEIIGETGNRAAYFFSLKNLHPARLRPYNAEEIPKLPFEVSEINSDFRTIVASCKGDKIWLGGASTAISTEELMRDFTINNKPAGVLEHLEKGVWVK